MIGRRLADMFRQIPTEDENRKVLQVLAMPVFSALCACVKLALSGYGPRGWYSMSRRAS